MKDFLLQSSALWVVFGGLETFYQLSLLHVCEGLFSTKGFFFHDLATVGPHVNKHFLSLLFLLSLHLVTLKF